LWRGNQQPFEKHSTAAYVPAGPSIQREIVTDSLGNTIDQ
jgi:hypothetical protein